MISWGFTVSRSEAGQASAVVVLGPQTEAAYDELSRKLKRLGLGRVNRGLWSRGALTRTQCSVTVEGDLFTQVRLGSARLVADVPMPMYKEWLDAAFAAEWVILGLVPAGALPPRLSGAVEIEYAQPGALVEELVASGTLLAGLAVVLDEPTPATGRTARTTRL